MYNVMGSGSSRGIYTLFVAAPMAVNGGKAVGLLRGASSRFATWFYALHHALRLKMVLLTTIHNPKFAELDLVKKNVRVRCAVMDIKHENFWKSAYYVLRAVFPALRALRYCDSNVPSMDKLCYLSHRVTIALQLSADKLNDPKFFSSLEDDEGIAELEQVFGEGSEPAGDQTTGEDAIVLEEDE